MRIIFDIDGTLVVDHDWRTLRPGLISLFDDLKEKKHELFLWSRRGYSHCMTVAERFTIHPLFIGSATKPYRRDTEVAKEKMPVEIVPFEDKKNFQLIPDCCVDNAGKHLLAMYGGIQVPTYRNPETVERGLAVVDTLKCDIETYERNLHERNERQGASSFEADRGSVRIGDQSTRIQMAES